MKATADQTATFLAALVQGDESALLKEIDTSPESDSGYAALFRSAVHFAARSPLYYRRLLDNWQRRGRPALKPRTRDISIEILADGTVNGLDPYLRLFCAVYGLHARVNIGDYDSVEYEALSTSGGSNADVTLVLLSEQWVKKRLGASIPTRTQVTETETAIGNIVRGLEQRRTGHIVVANFVPGAFPAPSSSVSVPDRVGWSFVVNQLNLRLAALATHRVHVLDAANALHLAGGAHAAGQLSLLRARAPFEERGMIALAREAASGIAQLFGASHRALLTDWDNTLWGGEVGEAGVHGIVCGQDSPDALGYWLLQSYIRDLNAQGTLIGGVSRNDPGIATVLDENEDLVLRREHFAGLALSWGNKSDSVSKLQSQFKFCTEFIVYVDDNLVDLGEVLLTFPYLDIVPAGPTADVTLARLVSPRFFNALQLTHGDIDRPHHAAALERQEQLKVASGDPAAFLKSLGIKLYVSDLNADNSARVLQLLQKTNQFNVTTRRHGETEIETLRRAGSKFGVFRYVDVFGSQGIIGLIILAPDGEGMQIDSWLMSCRVLNRGVEGAMFRWVRAQCGNQPLKGQFIATAKNALVRDLFPNLGFAPTHNGHSEAQAYVFQSSDPAPCTDHPVELVDE
jgi:FkbH-like protein